MDNTLEARLEMISRQILPEIRNKLFGANPSRFDVTNIIERLILILNFQKIQ